ncbi:MAG: FG-GAP repeat domain-containing protein [Acidimicrobiales bacterium]
MKGSAFGYWANGISLFGGAQPDTGPTPTVTLAADASNSPQSAAAATGLVSYGPARLLTSDTITLTSAGSLGTSGSVTTSSDIQNVNYAATQPTNTGSEIFGYPPPEPPNSQYINFNPNNLHTSVAGTATASESGVTGSTTITNGMLRTHSQSSTDCGTTYNVTPCGRAGEQHTHDLNNPEGVVTIPTNPPPNFTVTGHLHLGSTTTDYYVIVFNEQVTNPDGSITVTPVHEYLGYKLVNGQIVEDLPNAQGGSVLHGHLYLGRSTAGVTTVPTPTTSTTSTTTPTSTTSTTTPTSTTSTTVPPTSKIAPVADFDGFGSTDESVYRPSTGQWFVHGEKSRIVTPWGGDKGDIPVPGDYNADGTTDIAVYRPSSGQWFVRGGSPVVTPWWASGDIPVPGDYDGNGTTDIAVYRPSSGQWFVKDGSPVVTPWGSSGDIPVPGDYDGNGTTDIAVYRPSTGQWFVRGGQVTPWGSSGDIPVPGDYNADGTTDIAIYRPSSGQWFVRGGLLTPWGGDKGDIPVPGDYDGNGTTDIAIYRPSSGQWFVKDGSPVVTPWGISGDIPLPLPYAIQSVFFPQTGSPPPPTTTSTTLLPPTTVPV